MKVLYVLNFRLHIPRELIGEKKWVAEGSKRSPSVPAEPEEKSMVHGNGNHDDADVDDVQIRGVSEPLKAS